MTTSSDMTWCNREKNELQKMDQLTVGNQVTINLRWPGHNHNVSDDWDPSSTLDDDDDDNDQDTKVSSLVFGEYLNLQV